MPGPRPAVVMTPLALTVVGYLLLPAGDRDIAYVGIGVASMATAFWGLARQPPRRRTSWLLVLCGYAGWVLGDILVVVQSRVWHTAAYPAPSDAAYIASYGLMAAGLVMMVRRRGGHGDLAALLDATILASGVAVVAGVFIIAPAATDSSLSLSGKLASSLYPVADVLLIGILVRLWTTPGSRTSAFQLLAAAFGVTLLGDTIYNLRTIVTADTSSWAVNDAMWLSAYVLIAGASWAPSLARVTEAAPGDHGLGKPRRRLVVLTGGLLLPGSTLLIDGLRGGHIAWPVIGAGSILLSVLVLSRMAGLLTVVSAQSVRLAALARSDPLTGVANRRTWDHELSRACRAAQDAGTPLTVALLDLDHFKAYNDSFGHGAGDQLLREATAVWDDQLQHPELLSRYGGEEFAVLFPGQTPRQALGRVEALLANTPGDQTFSAGLASWEPGSDPATAVNEADRALYEAKRGGRNQVRLAAGTGASTPAVPRIVMQPIVDLRSRTAVGVEALSRFAHRDPAWVFADAHRSGRWSELEATVVTLARQAHPPGLFLTINLSIEALTSPEVGRALAGDLSGIVLEVTEHTETLDTAELAEAVRDYRSRGAILAVDDWGVAYSDTRRLLVLEPEIVKIDRSIVEGSASLPHRGAITGLVAWATAVGATTCAEGIETEEQYVRMCELGVHLGQGFLFGRAETPSAAENTDGPVISAIG